MNVMYTHTHMCNVYIIVFELLNHVIKNHDFFMAPWIVVHQALLSMRFPRNTGVPFPSPRDLPDPGIELTSLALAGRFYH